jgi:hypothetical protein
MLSLLLVWSLTAWAAACARSDVCSAATAATAAAAAVAAAPTGTAAAAAPWVVAQGCTQAVLLPLLQLQKAAAAEV